MATLIKERYEILELLGIGGEGRIVKALDRRHDRQRLDERESQSWPRAYSQICPTGESLLVGLDQAPTGQLLLSRESKGRCHGHLIVAAATGCLGSVGHLATTT